MIKKFKAAVNSIRFWLKLLPIKKSIYSVRIVLISYVLFKKKINWMQKYSYRNNSSTIVYCFYDIVADLP